jgi:TP901 family phage tail tape measure protein
VAEQFGLSVILKLIDRVSAPLRRVDAQFQTMGRRFNQHGQVMRQLGQRMTMAVTLPLAGLGFVAAKAAVDFESAFTGVRKTVDATESQFAELREGFQKMSTEVPLALESLYGIGEAAGQLGIETPNILGFSKVMADLGATTNLAGAEAAKALARFANIMQMPQDQFDELGSAIVHLGNNLATTEAEIVEMGLRLAGAGKVVGLSEAQVLGLAGALSSLGVRAQMGGSAFSRIMLKIEKSVSAGDEKLQLFARVSGRTASEFADLWKKDAVGGVMSFIEGLARLQKSGVDIINVFEPLGLSNIRVTDALLRIASAGDSVRKSIDMGTSAMVENTALTREAALRYKTAASQFRLFWNEVRLMLAAFGETFLPVLTELVKRLRPFVEWMKALSPTAKTIIVALTGLVAIVGPLIAVLGLMAGGLAALGVAAAPIAGVFLAIALGVAGVTAAVALLSPHLATIRRHLDAITDNPVVQFLMRHAGLGGLAKLTPAGMLAGIIGNRETAGGRAQANAPFVEQATANRTTSFTEIALKVLGPAVVEQINRRKGDADVNIISQGTLGQFAGAQ